MDLTAIFIGLFSFLKLLTIMAFVLAVIIVANVFGGRHRHQWRSREPSGQDQAILDDIARVAEKMERRLEALEKILEADDPKWKERAR